VLDLKPAAQLRRLAVASAFYELAIDEQLRETTPMRGIRRPNAANEDAPLGLDARSAERLLEHAQERSHPRPRERGSCCCCSAAYTSQEQVERKRRVGSASALKRAVSNRR